MKLLKKSKSRKAGRDICPNASISSKSSNADDRGFAAGSEHDHHHYRKIEKVYDIAAKFYDPTFGRFFKNGRTKAIDWMCESGIREPKVLEVGIGTGYSLNMYPRDYYVDGLDFSKGMLRKAEKRVEKHNLSRVELLHGNAMNMDLPDSHYDIVILAHLISTVPDPVKVMEEAKRVCKPNGRIFILNHFRQHKPIIRKLEKALAPLMVKVGWTTDLELQPLLDEVKLEASRIASVNLFGYWSLVECENIVG